jgi:DNA end-binding protein Ku
MPAHSIGSATLSFGLVSVPVKMFSTGESSAAVSFNWLHKKDGARLKQQYVCSKDGEKVEKDEMIKGYEFEKGRYVQFTTAELKTLDEKGTGTIDVQEFVPAKGWTACTSRSATSWDPRRAASEPTASCPKP